MIVATTFYKPSYHLYVKKTKHILRYSWAHTIIHSIMHLQKYLADIYLKTDRRMKQIHDMDQES